MVEINMQRLARGSVPAVGYARRKWLVNLCEYYANDANKLIRK